MSWKPVLYHPATMQGIAGQYVQLCTAIAADPCRELWQLSPLRWEEEQRILYDYDRITEIYRDDITLHTPDELYPGGGPLFMEHYRGNHQYPGAACWY